MRKVFFIAMAVLLGLTVAFAQVDKTPSTPQENNVTREVVKERNASGKHKRMARGFSPESLKSTLQLTDDQVSKIEKDINAKRGAENRRMLPPQEMEIIYKNHLTAEQWSKFEAEKAAFKMQRRENTLNGEVLKSAPKNQ